MNFGDYVPVSKAEAGASTAPHTTLETAPEAPTPPAKAPVRIVGGPDLTRSVPLIWAYEHEGATYSAVTVRRMTTGEVEIFVADARKRGAAAELPMFDVPHAVIDALMPDDAEAVNAVVTDFLPRTLRPAEA